MAHSGSVAHRASADLGHSAQLITGIAYFYRQFGYEPCLPMYAARGGFRQHVPPPAGAVGAVEAFGVRPATPEDAPFLAELEERGRSRSLVSVLRDAGQWRHEIDGMSDGHSKRLDVGIIEAVEGGARPAAERVGFLVLGRSRAPAVTVSAYGLVPGLSWLAVTPIVLRHIQALGEGRAERLRFQLGDAHPAYETLPEFLVERQPSDPEYVRVPDIPGFLRAIAPVLERRLATSVAVGHTGRLRLGFFRDGVLLRFANGRLAEVASCPHHAPSDEVGPHHARFPDRTFL
jgi:hypothetical protein